MTRSFLPQSVARFPLALALAASPLAAYPLGFAPAIGDGFHGSSVDGRAVAANLDVDPELEVFAGGNWVAHPAGYLVSPSPGPHTHTTLPEPSRTPYGIQHPIRWDDCSGDVADVDLDGDLDLVRAVEMYYQSHAENRHVVVVYLNNGSGSFTIGWQKTYEGERLGSVRFADFDRDGDPDIAQATPSKVRILWNDGQATGQFPTASPVADRSTSGAQIEILDADRDGWPDLAWFDYQTDSYRLRWALNDHDRTFTAKSGWTTTANPRQLTAHDVDRDGWPDLVAAYNVVNYTNNVLNQTGLVTWTRNESSDFGSPTPVATFPGTSVGCLSLADLDEDGDDDLLTITDGGVDVDDHVWMSFRTGPTHFELPRQYGDTVYTFPAVASGDVDADGDTDLCFLSYSSAIVWIRNAAIHPSAAAAALQHASPALAGPAALATGDLDSDGTADLIVACPAEKRLLWYRGGDNALPGPVIVGTSGVAVSSVAASDFDRDGDTDLAYTAEGSATIYRALSFNGAGTTFTTTAMATMAGVAALRSADCDRDGDVDLLASSPSAGIARWLKNDGQAGTWLPENVATSLPGLQWADPVETEPGGRPEVGLRLAGSLRVDAAAPSWQTWSQVFVPGEAMAWADFNRDGQLDVAFSDLLGGVHWGDLSFASPALRSIGTTGGTVRGLATVDWNKDARPDVLCAWSNGVTLFTNHPSGWTPVTLAAGGDHGAIIPFDLNGDDRPDAVAHNRTNGKLVPLLNTSWEVRVEQAAAASTPSAPVRPGQTGPVIRLRVTHPGLGYDDRLFPASLKVRLLRANPLGRGYTPGNPLTQAETDELIESVAVYNESYEEIGRTPSTALVDGYLSVNQVFGGPIGVATGRARDLLLCVALKPGAGGAAHQRFFLQHRAIPLLGPGSSWWYGLGSPRSLRATSPLGLFSALVEVTPLAPLPAWRKAWWDVTAGTGAAANHADPDSDGVPNLVEYVTGTNPTLAEAGLNAARSLTLTPATFSEMQGGADLFLGFVLGYPWDDTITIQVQQSDNLKTWQPLSTRIGRQAWTGVAPDVFAAEPEGTGFRVEKDGVGGHPARAHFRLRITETP